MKCMNCQSEVPEGSKYCLNCGAKLPASCEQDTQQSSYDQNMYQSSYDQNSYQAYEMQQETINWVPYLVLAIFSTVCCCLPFGIAAIIYAVKINNASVSGNYREAQSAARMAKIWIIAAIAGGVLLNVGSCAVLGAFNALMYY